MDWKDTPTHLSGDEQADSQGDTAPVFVETTAALDATEAVPAVCAHYHPGGQIPVQPGLTCAALSDSPSQPHFDAAAREALPLPVEAPVRRPLLIPLFSAAVLLTWLAEILLPALPHFSVNDFVGANALLYALLVSAALASFMQNGVRAKCIGCGLSLLAAFLRAWGLTKAKLVLLSSPITPWAALSEADYLTELFLSAGPCVLMAAAALVLPLFLRKKTQRRAYLYTLAASALSFGLLYALLSLLGGSIVQPGKPLSSLLSALLLCAVLFGAGTLLLFNAADANGAGISPGPKLYLQFCIGFLAAALAALLLLCACDAFFAALIAASAFGIWRLLRSKRDGLYLFAAAPVCMLADGILSLLRSIDTGFPANTARILFAAFCALLPILAILLIRHTSAFIRMPGAEVEADASCEEPVSEA